ncbi:hypothetical protein ADILRU_1165 [Leifsonia rubra CMS 76R]|nr:hypothetical protein ADILRU_1165 [Leifsonia rubra CMS 76R]
MQNITTRQAAAALGVSQRQVTELLRSGKLGGEQLRDGTWLVSRRSISERKAFGVSSGRAWSSASSWALLGELSGRTAEGMSQSTRDRIKRRIRLNSADDIARKVATRSTTHRYWADSSEKTASALILTGASAAERIDHNLTRDTRVVEGYLHGVSLEDFVRQQLLTADNEGDVVIYDNFDQKHREGNHASRSVIAADLARSLNTRERASALSALEEMRQRWLAQHTR